MPQALDEESGPQLVFADGTETIFLADMSGDGLTDLVRIRNGEVCYWPNLGYGRFGAKVTMDGAPWFERRDLFDGRRIRLADIDGSGTIDIVYFAAGAVHLYFNQSDSRLGRAARLGPFPIGGERVFRGRDGPAGQWDGLPGMVIRAARKCAPADALHRFDGWPKAPPAGARDQ